ncbi:MAG: hypothetical protein ACI8RT_001013 [Candidatus Azotimanducaceae bacterium]|jgi:hypothetical protein|tara:strand:- start:442 stop:618 length:177 start_codon:yes stop_codon:yes gene_type:complete
MKWIVLAYISGLVATCGQKGPLQLPGHEETVLGGEQRIVYSIHPTILNLGQTQRTMTP